MKTMGWCFAVGIMGVLAGCASHTVRTDDDAPTSASLVNTKMNASLSSDSAGVEDQNSAPAPSGAMPVPMTIDQLPPAAQKTIRHESGQKRVVKIRREDHDGQIVYRVELTRDGGLFHGLLEVTPNGTLLRASHISKPASENTSH